MASRLIHNQVVRKFYPQEGYQGIDASELVHYSRPPQYRIEAERLKEQQQCVSSSHASSLE